MDNQQFNWYHGSNSASLVGVCRGRNPGLKSLGRLLKEGIVPFSGGLEEGADPKDGTNHSGVSAVNSWDYQTALYYADFFLNPWNPSIGEEAIRKLDEGLEGLKDSLSRPLERGFAEVRYRVNRFRKKVEKQRLEAWEQLSPFERELVENPFPVMYLIKYDGPHRSKKSGCVVGKYDYTLLCDRIPLEPGVLKICSREEDIPTVREYLSEQWYNNRMSMGVV